GHSLSCGKVAHGCCLPRHDHFRNARLHENPHRHRKRPHPRLCYVRRRGGRRVGYSANSDACRPTLYRFARRDHRPPHHAGRACASPAIRTGKVSAISQGAKITVNAFEKNATVILVHGAWTDGSSWSPVIEPLREAGLEVVCAPIPL